MKVSMFAFPTLASAFVTPSPSLVIQKTPFILPPTTTTATTTASTPIITHYSPSSPLSMAGFGGGGSSTGSKKGGGKKKGGGGGMGGGASTSSSSKLKPKTQWDRYKSLKEASSVTVAMRVMYEGTEVGKWRTIGTVRSEGDEFTEMAVALQKGIITEHAKRLHPLQFLPKDTVQWAYSSNTNANTDDTDDDWIIINEKLELPPGADKKVGFQGNADPSGYYAQAGAKGYDGTAAEKKRGYN